LRLTSVDARLRNLLATNHSEVIGTPYYEILPRISRQKTDWIEEAIRSGKSICRRFRLCCFFGGFDADICIETVKDGEANVTGALVMVSPYPFCEFFNEVERNQHLVDVGKTSRILGHGMRNRLHTIKGSLLYLEKKYGEEAEVSEMVNLAFDEIAQIDDLISRLLESPTPELTRNDTDINVVLQEMEPFIALQASACNVVFSTSYGDAPPAPIDPFYLELALYNVFRNSLEAMPKGGALTVETCSVERSGKQYASVKISDTGCGMSRKQVQALLSGQNSKRRRGNGLLITRDILRSHDGYVSIKSEEGIGATVQLSIPVAMREGRHGV